MSLGDPFGRQPAAPRRGLGFLWIALILGMVAYWYWSKRDLHDPNAVPRPVTARGSLAEDELATIEVFKRASPSVVFITTLAERRDAFSLSVQRIPQGTGSGFVWDEKGHIVTNFHVVQNSNRIAVTLAGHSTYDATLVGQYPDKDLAVLRINAPSGKLPPIPIGTSTDLQVGQTVFAIGNPFGLDQTLTKGIISALDREIESVTGRPIKGVIQTDAAINPGNSGGPLLDSAGRVIGVNTAIISPSQVSAGIGFAIPIDEVNRVVPNLIAHGQVERPGLGITLAPEQVLRRLNKEGVLVLNVVPDGAAAKAGIQPTTRDPATSRIKLGDVIVALGGKPIKNSRDLLDALEQRKVGETVTVTVLRDEERIDLKVTLEPLRQ